MRVVVVTSKVADTLSGFPFHSARIVKHLLFVSEIHLTQLEKIQALKMCRIATGISSEEAGQEQIGLCI